MGAHSLAEIRASCFIFWTLASSVRVSGQLDCKVFGEMGFIFGAGLEGIGGHPRKTQWRVRGLPPFRQVRERMGQTIVYGRIKGGLPNHVKLTSSGDDHRHERQAEGATRSLRDGSGQVF
jgi:hypothetical protein